MLLPHDPTKKRNPFFVDGNQPDLSENDRSQKPSITRRRKNAVSTIIGLVLGGFIILNLQYTHTFHPFETLGILFLWSLVPAAYTAFCIYRARPQWLFQSNATSASPVTSTLLTLPLLTMIFAMILNMANQWLDMSEAQTRTFTITGKHYFRGSKSGPHYQILINVPDVPARLSLNENRTDEVIDISPETYPFVIAERSRIKLEIHQGFLGFPWFERNWSFDDLSNTAVSEQPRQSNTHLPPAALIAEACVWSENFNADREIESLPPDDFRRDFWPNNQPRSVEPLVHGEVHGIGHYTFANGKLYGNIPWKHGRKHGIFTLYREDGSIEQALSYKEGQAFGINRWYNPDGSLKERWLLIGDGKFFPVSMCDSDSHKD